LPFTSIVTSIAAAITAGAAALYLEWAVERGYNTDITNAEIKNDFIRGAVRLESRVYHPLLEFR